MTGNNKRMALELFWMTLYKTSEEDINEKLTAAFNTNIARAEHTK
jgi:hypothetical protein